MNKKINKMKYQFSLLLTIASSNLWAQTSQFISGFKDDPIDGIHRYVSNGDLQFHQFSDTPDSVVVFGISNSYFCEDEAFYVQFAIWVNGAWKNSEIVLFPYNASEWAYADFPISDPFIQDLIKGSKYVYRYDDAHCSIERGEGSLSGVTAGFNKARIPLK